MRHQPHRLRAAFTALMCGATLAIAPPASAAQAAAPPVNHWFGWVQVAGDEFNGTSLDTSKWSAMSGTPGCCKSSRWDPAMVKVGNGRLTLQNKPVNGVWKSGGVGSWNWADAVMTYGRVDIRVRFDAGWGVSAAALMWPDKNRSWPPEVDFYEIGRDQTERSQVMITNHYKDGAGAHKMTQVFHPGRYTDWHTVSMRWSRSSLLVYVDNTLVMREFDRAKISQLPMWIGLQTHVEPKDGRWPALAQGQDSINLQVDYVRIYQRSWWWPSNLPTQPSGGYR